jgi:hypothetical protein
MFSTSDYQIVVTTYDGSGLWKDHLLNQRNIADAAGSVNERDVRCFVPTFWSGIPRPARSAHVGFTVRGKAYRLPWPPPDGDSVPPPALRLHIRPRYTADEMPTSVGWDAVPAG